LIPILQNNFPDRVHRVIVVNEHWGLSFFWAAISILLPSCVKAKITFLGSKFDTVLHELLSDTHPYLQYMIKVRQHPEGKVPLPARAPYIARCFQDSEASDGPRSHYALDVNVDQGEGESVPSTVASPTDLPKIVDDDDLFCDCREEDDAEVISISPKSIPLPRSTWTSFFGCSCVRKT